MEISPEGTAVTNGKVIISVQAEKEIPSEHYPTIPGITPTEKFEPFTVQKPVAEKVLKSIPTGSIPAISCAMIGENAEGDVHICTTDLEAINIIPVKKYITFPNYRGVLERTETPKYTIMLNLIELEGMVKILKKITAGQHGKDVKLAEFLFFAADEAVVVKAVTEQGQEVTAAIMPCT